MYRCGGLDRAAFEPRPTSNQFGFDHLEERFGEIILVEIYPAAHGKLEAILTQQLLIIVRTALAGVSV
jgi:hypothetical protein